MDDISIMKKNCWEFIGCGREIGGDKAADLGGCPAASCSEYNGTNRGKNAGRVCWAIAGTKCNNRTQGEFSQKLVDCKSCDFFNKVKSEEGDRFQLL